MKLLCYLLLVAFVVAMPTIESRTNDLTTCWTSQFEGAIMPSSIKDYLPARDNKIDSSEFVTNDPRIVQDTNVNHCRVPPSEVMMMETDKKSLTSTHFLEKDLWNDKLELYPRFPLNSGKAHFIRRSVVERFPTLKAANLPLILSRFSINSNESKAIRVINHTIALCEYASKEDNVCVTSLESMVDFVQSTLALNKGQGQDQRQSQVHGGGRGHGRGCVIRAYSTSLPNKNETLLLNDVQPYGIVDVKRVSNNNAGDVKSSAISCHKAEFPFAVFLCHQRPSTVPYMVTIEGKHDKTRIQAAIACHMDTSDWDPPLPGPRRLERHPWHSYLSFSQSSQCYLGC